MTGTEILKMLEKEGWKVVRTRGSHRQLKHPTKKGKVTVSFHNKKTDIDKGTYNSILKQAGMK
ncbi:MAG: type II toxin-antitoxin system HicA family toxin [Cetobacterium sp.]|uniref:type II toxin-antitoxin system HicA family toxin n=1 Tax=Cetobacterium sp. TaxID=2071632 RepID=UPI003EE4F3DB